MSQKHTHQVTPMHKGKSGFFSEDEGDRVEVGKSVRDLMGGINEVDDDAPEEKLYAHELPPDPFMQKLTINEDEEEDEDYDEDFLEESAMSSASAKITSSQPAMELQVEPSLNSSNIDSTSAKLISPISVMPSPSSKNVSTSNLIKDMSSNIDTLVDKVNTATSELPISVSVPLINPTSPPPSHSKHVVLATPPRSTSRSPRSTGSRKKIKSGGQKLRQSPIRVVSQDPIPSPKKKSKHVDYSDEDFEYEEDFSSEVSSSPQKSKHVTVVGSPSVKNASESQLDDEDDLDDMFETMNPLKEVNTEGEESSNLIEGKIEGMTLEAYMMEYTKARELDEAVDKKESGGDDEDSPPVVDPVGLEGCSPGPGQKHINGTDSPFRIDVREFGGNDFEVVGDDNYDDDEVIQVSSSQNGEILATILTQVQDVQTKLVELSSQNTSPSKPRRGVSFSNPSDESSTKKKQKGSFQHSPIEKNPGSKNEGHMTIAEKVASGINASLAAEGGSANSSLSGDVSRSKKEKKNSSESGQEYTDSTNSNSTPLEVKVDVLKKQLRKKNEDSKKMEDKLKRMEKEMENMHNKWRDAEDSLKATEKKLSKSNKAKITAQKKVTEMSQEMQHYESLIQAVEQLRENETMLLQKVNQLEDQNFETAKALKASMSRELEWRALYKKEHGPDGQFGNNQHHSNNAPRASSGMNSHRSLPDPERPHVRQSKPIYERNSITEGRQKKKKKSSKDKDGGNNRQKILPILLSKQRK